MKLKCNPISGDSTFAIYVEASVSYDGRASSVLERGNYLIIRKQDGSIMIHGANHVPALNYMGNGSIIEIKGNSITATRRSEIIKIEIYKWHDALKLPNWSTHKIVIKRTEAELVNKIASNPARYFGPGDYISTREYATTAGPVDLVIMQDIDLATLHNVPLDSRIHIIEAKRKKITLKDCYQLKRYLDAIAKSGLRDITGCLAGPEISGNALAHCKDNNFRYLQVRFEEEAL